LLLNLGGHWIMRTIPFVGLPAVIALVALPALADAPAPTVEAHGTAWHVKAPDGYHLNPGYTWKICTVGPDGKCPPTAGVTFAFVDAKDKADTTDHPKFANFTPVAGVLKGGFCQDGGNGCNTFKATCTASGCSAVTTTM
jgi:hypothetical protein